MKNFAPGEDIIAHLWGFISWSTKEPVPYAPKEAEDSFMLCEAAKWVLCEVYYSLVLALKRRYFPLTVIANWVRGKKLTVAVIDWNSWLNYKYLISNILAGGIES